MSKIDAVRAAMVEAMKAKDKANPALKLSEFGRA